MLNCSLLLLAQRFPLAARFFATFFGRRHVLGYFLNVGVEKPNVSEKLASECVRPPAIISAMIFAWHIRNIRQEHLPR